jgi:hypothetical protein
VKIGMDVAASEFLTEDKMYDLKFKEKNNDGSGKKTGCARGAARQGGWRSRPAARPRCEPPRKGGVAASTPPQSARQPPRSS